MSYQTDFYPIQYLERRLKYYEKHKRQVQKLINSDKHRDSMAQRFNESHEQTDARIRKRMNNDSRRF